MTSLTSLVLPLVLAVLGVASQDYVIEVYFVVEPQVLRNYVAKLGYDVKTAKETVRGDIDFILHQVNTYFKSLQRYFMDVDVRVKKLHFIGEEMYEDCKFVKAKKLHAHLSLERFREWLNETDAFEKIGYDMALLWTGYDLFGADRELGTSGYASAYSICNPDSNIAVTEFLGEQSTAVHTAHAIGNVLGAVHDEDQVFCPMSREGDYYGDFIMSRRYEPGNRHRWEFSQCAFHHFKKNMVRLDGKGENCLLPTETTTRAVTFDLASRGGRDILDVEKVCQRARMNKNGYFCQNGYYEENRPVTGDKMCQAIYCGLQATHGCTIATPTEGMVCDVGKRCNRGRCVQAPMDFPTPANLTQGCINGDVKSRMVLGEMGSCSTYLRKKGAWNCYKQDVWNQCCATCTSIKQDISGCEYGDLSDTCRQEPLKTVCTTRRNECCQTCRDVEAKKTTEPSIPFSITRSA